MRVFYNCYRPLGAVIALSVMLLAPPPVRAQDFSAAAIVNDQIITGYDVAQRAILLSAASGGGAPQALRNAALDALIEDTLRLQAARAAGVDPSPEAVRDGFDELSRLNGRDPAQMRAFFQGRGVTQSALDQQVRAEVAWRELIQRRYGPRARISEEDVARELESNGGDRYRLAQIVVAAPANVSDSVADAAFRAALAARQGFVECDVPVSYKSGAYLPISGLLGDMALDDIPGAVRAAVRDLPEGGVSQPVRSNDGFHVIKLCAKRSAAADIPPAHMQEMRNKLMSEKLGRYSRTLMRELKREAVVERR